MLKFLSILFLAVALGQGQVVYTPVGKPPAINGMSLGDYYTVGASSVAAYRVVSYTANTTTVIPHVGTGTYLGISATAAATGAQAWVVGYGVAVCEFDSTPVPYNVATVSEDKCHDSGVTALSSVSTALGAFGRTQQARTDLCANCAEVIILQPANVGRKLQMSDMPSGLITFVTSGACSAGWSQVTALNGVTLLGTLAANGDVGGTGGSNNITPAGTNGTVSFTPAGTNSAPTFTGQAGTVPAQTFTGNSVTSSATSAGTPAGTNGASATSGNCAATNIAAGTGSTTACKATAPNLTVTAQTFTGSALSTHTHTTTATGTNSTAAFTPAGTVSAPTFTGNSGTVPAETFTGTQFDNRSAFLKVIFCSKD